MRCGGRRVVCVCEYAALSGPGRARTCERLCSPLAHTRFELSESPELCEKALPSVEQQQERSHGDPHAGAFACHAPYGDPPIRCSPSHPTPACVVGSVHAHAGCGAAACTHRAGARPPASACPEARTCRPSHPSLPHPSPPPAEGRHQECGHERGDVGAGARRAASSACPPCFKLACWLECVPWAHTHARVVRV